jgi:hypothetical protein
VHSLELDFSWLWWCLWLWLWWHNALTSTASMMMVFVRLAAEDDLSWRWLGALPSFAEHDFSLGVDVLLAISPSVACFISEMT